MSIPRRTRVILGGEGGDPRREFCLSRPVALLLGVLVLGGVVGAAGELLERDFGRPRRRRRVGAGAGVPQAVAAVG